MDFTIFDIEKTAFVLNQIELIKKIKGLPYLDFIFKLVDIKNIFKPKQEEYNEKAELLNRKRTELILVWCKKDKNDKPIVENGNYIGLDRGMNKEYDIEFDNIVSSIKSLNKKTFEFSDDEKKRIDMCIIDKKILENKTVKDEFTGDMYEAIGYFVGK